MTDLRERGGRGGKEGRRRRLVPSFDTSFTVMILLINFLILWTISSYLSAFL
jgi:hypothetical protein